MASARRRMILILAVAGCAGLAAAQPAASPPYVSAPPFQALTPTYQASSPATDGANVMAALAAGKSGDGLRARAAMNAIYDPLARKIALWALIDGAPTEVSFAEAESARRELAGWPRESRRQEAAEAALGRSGMAPAQVVVWFGGEAPSTGAGALALAQALNASGQQPAAAEVIRKAWRTLIIDPTTQAAILASFSGVLNSEDYAARQSLLYSAIAERSWRHGSGVGDALRAGDNAGAYAAAANSGLTTGAAGAEAQFYAGWIALTRLNDPRRADEHFAKVALAGQSPLTQSRAYFWRGRAAEAEGDQVNAQLFYGQAARYFTTFYGQLAAAKIGETTLTLGKDPTITATDRATFEARDVIRAVRYLAGIGAREEFKAFTADLADSLPSAAEEAMLVDVVRGLGDQQAAMRVVRNAAKRNLILPERGYPLATAPVGYEAPEPAFVLGIVRQESSFDPHAHSGAGARGMMQLMPTTASILARRLGIEYSSYELEDPVYNMRLGAAYLGQLVSQFNGSYIMAAAGYNAGPGRPTQWTTQCGDPRSASTDPLNYIECIPFSETRDYVMRTLEATEVYRARLRGGSAPLTLAGDLRRGAYSYRASVP
ncbi:MAG TPA: lytic transglycosylase domain-containing protein [Caulobacteraceae bacterium]